MDIYGQIKFDLVMKNGGSILQAYKELNSLSINQSYHIFITEDGKVIVFSSDKKEINNVDVKWESEYDDEVC